MLKLLALASLSLAAAAPAAAAGPAHYRAIPASAPASARLIAHGLIWNCTGGVCVAPKSDSRPAIDCSALVREVGALKSFAVQGRDLEAQDLEKCNARAR
ncbi:MAG: hypothetical protein E6G94_05195 [Alphaproteobacteria bacterium]|nr:MAG: hypothetical protein E6G94_05195 [Alphaproteobacteria bacterium]